MRETEEDLNSVSYYLEKNRALAPLNLRAATSAAASSGAGAQQTFLSPAKLLSAESSPLMHYDPILTAAATQKNSPRLGRLGAAGVGVSLPTGVKGDERVGNFPVRLLVMLGMILKLRQLGEHVRGRRPRILKLSKLVEFKQNLVRQLQEMNAQGERMNLIGNYYPREFQERYAQIVVDLEHLNKQIQAYLNGVGDYENTILPQLTQVTVTSRPETLRRLCNTHALQIVKHCNNGLNVKSGKMLDLITSLTSLLLQVRSLGQQSTGAYELQSLSEALQGLRLQVSPRNAGSFQDNVEVHMKQIHYYLLKQHGGDKKGWAGPPAGQGVGGSVKSEMST